MKFYFVSDIYAEGASEKNPIVRKPTKDIDAIIVAGNVRSGEDLGIFLLQMFEDFPETPVIYVAGDHEHFQSNIPICELVEKFKNESSIIRSSIGKDFFYLENSSVTMSINDEMIKFIGSTLWSGFGRKKCDAEIIATARDSLDIFDACMGMGDKRYPPSITTDFASPRPLVPEDIITFNTLSHQYLEAELKAEFDGRVVVVTHYPPLLRSLNKEDLDDNVKQFHYSDCEYLFNNHIDLWVHGHVGQTLEYKVKNTVVASNPHGNPKNINLDYIQDRVIEI